MIFEPSHPHCAQYDEDGNIRLPEDGDTEPPEYSCDAEELWTVMHCDDIHGEQPQKSRLTRHGSGPSTALPFDPSELRSAEAGRLPFDKLPFDKLPFDKLPFDKLPFDKLPFDKLPFDKLPFDKLRVNDYRAAALPCPASIFQDIRGRLTSVTQSVFAEGAEQYHASALECASAWRQCLSSVRIARRHIWAILTQPVWIQNRRTKNVKEYSRWWLFVLDTVRFGTTFAVLFGMLFVSLNYQSFWQITASALSPIKNAQREAIASADTGQPETPASRERSGRPGDLFSFLPPVGPPENLIIIPKMGLTVPLVTTPSTALLEENWDRLEKDIQDALQHGVVHYPGTAKPGQAGNFFVTGHSSYYPWAQGRFKTVFARLGELEPGDEYFVYHGGDRHRYVIRDKKEVKPSDVRVLDQPVNKRLATLMTCTPVGTTLRRLILVAEEVDPITGIAMDIGKQPTRVLPKIQAQMLPI